MVGQVNTTKTISKTVRLLGYGHVTLIEREFIASKNLMIKRAV